MMKKFSSGMLGVVSVIVLIIGGFVTLNLVKKHEMVTLVQSTQVRESIENQLKDLDKKRWKKAELFTPMKLMLSLFSITLWEEFTLKYT